MRLTRTSVLTILEHAIGLAREVVHDGPAVDDELLATDICGLLDALDLLLQRYRHGLTVMETTCPFDHAPRWLSPSRSLH